MNPRLTIVSDCNPIVFLLLAITISVSAASAYVLHPLHLLELMTSEPVRGLLEEHGLQPIT